MKSVRVCNIAHLKEKSLNFSFFELLLGQNTVRKNLSDLLKWKMNLVDFSDKFDCFGVT